MRRHQLFCLASWLNGQLHLSVTCETPPSPQALGFSNYWQLSLLGGSQLLWSRFSKYIEHKKYLNEITQFCQPMAPRSTASAKKFFKKTKLALENSNNAQLDAKPKPSGSEEVVVKDFRRTLVEKPLFFNLSPFFISCVEIFTHCQVISNIYR